MIRPSEMFGRLISREMKTVAIEKLIYRQNQSLVEIFVHKAIVRR